MTAPSPPRCNLLGTTPDFHVTFNILQFAIACYLHLNVSFMVGGGADGWEREMKRTGLGCSWVWWRRTFIVDRNRKCRQR